MIVDNETFYFILLAINMMIGEVSEVAAVNKNDYGTKSPLEKEERKNIVKIVTRIYTQKSNADFVAKR